MKRIRSTIKPWFGRFRAEILIDGHLVQKAFFLSESEARLWCKEQEKLFEKVVREA